MAILQLRLAVCDQDHRAIGVVYIAPTAIWRDHAEQIAYAATFADAEAAVARGEARTEVTGLQTLNLWWNDNRPETCTPSG